jgi:cell division septation protein DedD
MCRPVYLIFILILGISCAPKPQIEELEEVPVDTLVITEMPVAVETVYVTTTVVETVYIYGAAEEKAPPPPAVEEEVTEEITTPIVTEVCNFKVQLGAFIKEENANALHSLLKSEYGELVYIDHIPPYWKVRIGRYRYYKSAASMRDKFRAKSYKDAWVVPMHKFK